jgi:hypothetical protein
MMMRILKKVLFGAFAVALFVPTAATAQQIGKAVDEGLAKEMGIKAAQFVIYPTLGAAYQYNTNLFYVSDSDDAQKPTAAGMIMAYPGLLIEAGKNAPLGLSINGQLEARKYLDSGDAASGQSNFGGIAGFKALFFKEGPVQFGVTDQFKYLLQRRNVEVAGTWDRVYNSAGASLGLVPGGGALRFNLGYDYIVDYFTDTANDWGDVQTHQVTGKFNWKFLPFTSLFADVNWQLRDYVAKGYGVYGETTDNSPVKARVGVNGAFTRTISAMVVAGWGNSMHDGRPVAAGESVNKGENDSYNGFIGGARITWRPSKKTMAQVGYLRDFRDNLFTNYLVSDEIKLTVKQRVGSRVQITADAAYTWLGYSAVPFKFMGSNPAIASMGDIERADTQLRLSLGADADITRWLGVSLKYSMENLMSDFFVKNAVTGNVDKMDYKAHIIDAMLVFRY